MYFIRPIEVDELPAWQHIRTEVYLKLGFITENQLNDEGLYIDGEDNRAHHIAAFDPFGQMVGTFRLIMRMRGRRLPVERDYSVRIHRKKISAELSGLAVLDEHRNGLVMLGLLRTMYDLAIEHNVHDVYAELEKPLLYQLLRLGFPFQQIGDSKLIFNTVNWPTRMDVRNILPTMFLRDADRITSYAPFFIRSFDGFVFPHSLEPGHVNLSTALEA